MKKEPLTVTVEQLQQLAGSFRNHITETNIPEIKKFIANFIESVVVHVDTVHLNICFWGLMDGGESACIKAKIQKRRLLRHPSERTVLTC